MKNFLIAIFTVFSFLGMTQNHTIVVSGKVKNEKNKPLDNAHLYSSVYGVGTTTDKNGYFELILSAKETSIIATHISYKPQKIELTQKYHSDTLILDIKLKTKSNFLGEVEINESKRYLVVKPDKIWVYDYLLVNKKSMLLLLKDEKKYELRLIKEGFGQISNRVIEKGKKCFLEEDGLGKKYLCKGDSVFQISITQEGIQLYFEEFYKPFQEIVGPVVAGNSDYIFFKEYALNQQLITYFGINRKTHKKKFLTQIFDKEVFENVNYINREIGRLKGITVNPIEHSYISRTQLSNALSIFYLPSYRDQIVGLPINCPIINYNTNIYIFNLIKNVLEVFDAKGNLTNTIPMKLKNNPSSIEIDQQTGDFYAISLIKGIINVEKFDVNSGEPMQSFKLSNYTFPEKIKFRNNHILFMYSDFDFNKKLFHMPINRLNSIGI